MQLAVIKKIAINSMIVSLIGAAVVAVIAVLVGEFNDIFGRALFTLLVVALHALVCLAFLESRSKIENMDSLKFFTDTLFILIVLSFVTAIFGIWDIASGSIVAKLYGTYFIAAFASLHGEMLYKAQGVEKTISSIVYGNYIFMAVVIALLLPVVWAADADFPGFYYRLLAAAAIVDATLTILAVILYKLYLQKHPKVESEIFTQVVYTVDAEGNKVQQTVAPNKRRTHPLLILLGLYIALQFLAPLFFLIASIGR